MSCKTLGDCWHCCRRTARAAAVMLVRVLLPVLLLLPTTTISWMVLFAAHYSGCGCGYCCWDGRRWSDCSGFPWWRYASSLFSYWCCCSSLQGIVLYCIVLYCIVLYCTVLYSVELNGGLRRLYGTVCYGTVRDETTSLLPWMDALCYYLSFVDRRFDNTLSYVISLRI